MEKALLVYSISLKAVGAKSEAAMKGSVRPRAWCGLPPALNYLSSPVIPVKILKVACLALWGVTSSGPRDNRGGWS